jgi:hypothetical protein
VAFPHDAVVLGDVAGQVGEQGDGHGAEAALRTRCVDPGQVSKVRVGGACDHLELIFRNIIIIKIKL